MHLIIFPKDKTNLERLSFATQREQFVLGHMILVAKVVV